MRKMDRFVYLLFVFIVLLFISTGCSHKSFIKKFDDLPDQGDAIPINGKVGINQSGGHIQGIQMYKDGPKKVVFLSGSSNEVAFIIRAEVDEKARIISADTLMLDPYRHAGGFQIFGQYLAIGIEDNKLRTTSRVMVYDLNQDNVWSDPVQRINRDGAFERVTAGAVGMTLINGYYLIVVANWDSRNLDVYICPEDQMVAGQGSFRCVASLDMGSSSRKNWIESTWRSYQNINLFFESGDLLYMVGFATNGDGENVADVYRMKMEKSMFNDRGQPQSFAESFSITKIESRKFQSASNTSFRWGAGLYQEKNGRLTLLSCPEHIGRSSNVESYTK